MTYPEFVALFIERWHDNESTNGDLIDLEFHLQRQERHWGHSRWKKDAIWNRMLDLGEDFLTYPTQDNFKLFEEEVYRALPQHHFARRYG